MKFSELIGKKVISLYDKYVTGVTIGAIFKNNYKNIAGLVVEDNREEAMFDELYLDVKQLFSYSGDALVIKNNYALTSLKKQNEVNPIGLEAYSVKGKSLGKVIDLELNDSFEVTAFITKEDSIQSSLVAGINSRLMLVQEEDSKVDITKFRHKTKKIKSACEVSTKAVILPVYGEQEDVKEEQAQEAKPQVKRVSTFSSGVNLLGRVATQNITAQNGEIVCRAGCKITDEIITRANAYSKLRELSFYAK